MGIMMRNRFLGEEMMSDLIRRDDAIEAIKNCSPPYVPIFTNDFYCAVQAVERVPSAQPTSTLFGYKVDHLNVIACEDCKHYIPHDKRCGFWNHGVKTYDWCSRAEGKSDG